jgi:FkbH-like protein
MKHAHRDLATLKELGNAHLAERRYEAAAEAYEEAAQLSELPRGGLCVRLARAHLAAGRPEVAAAWLMSLVDTAPSFKTWSAAAGLLGRCPVDTWPRVRRRLEVGLVGTWTTSTFAPLLRLAAAPLGLALSIHQTDFGQYFNETLDPDSPLLAGRLDALILAPDPRAMGLKPFTETAEADVAAEVERWSAVWSAVRRRASPSIVQHGFAAAGRDPLGHHAAGLPGTRRSMIARINSDLARRAAEADVGYLDLEALAAGFGTARWFDSRGWYMARMPYAPDALPLLARHTAAVLAARLGLSRRCIVLDLDNTLWGGVVGDDGLEGITLGSGTAGEAFADFQVGLKEMLGRGIVLAVCSKNDPEVALAPFREHPEMVLKESDIAAFVANWGPKSANIPKIADMLGLGLDSLILLDDNPYERAEVRRALPEVDVPVMPEDPTDYRRVLEDYPYFEPAVFTSADRDRAGQYRARAEAEAMRASAASLAEYQAGLDMTATFGAIDAVNLPRVLQLINKSNQFNLTTIRRNRTELEALLSEAATRGFWVRLEDKFADHGLIAVALARVERPRLEIDTLLMSCRVLGRGLERLVVAELARIAVESGCREVVGRYLRTARNGMVADLYARLGFAEAGEDAAGATLWRAAPPDLTADDVPIRPTWAGSQPWAT